MGSLPSEVFGAARRETNKLRLITFSGIKADSSSSTADSWRSLLVHFICILD